MNKYIINFAGAAIICMVASCYKDTGNYTYKPAEEITITGIGERYDKVSLEDRITFDPEVSSTDPDAEFEYYWGIYDVLNAKAIPILDTISRTKRIDLPVTQHASEWKLVFNAKNKKTGFSKFVISNITVITRFTRGWYVAKDDGTYTDVDLFLTPVSIAPESKLENVFSLVNEKKIEGKASSFCFLTSYQSTVTGINNSTRALFVQSDKDLSVVNINTFLEIRNINTLFYEPPSVRRPLTLQLATQGSFLVNNGLLHSITTVGTNTGQFGAAQLRDDKNSPYNLSKYALASYSALPLFFDETSSSFLSATGKGTVMTSVADAAGNKISANNNNKTLLYMGLKTQSPFAGWAILQDKTNPDLKILCSVKAPTAATPVTLAPDTLLASDKIYNATMYTLIFGDENIIYFVKGNEIWSRNLANKTEQLQFTVPAGEEVAFIRHRKYAGTAPEELPFYYNYFIIGTTSGDNYKVRMFTKTAGNLSAIPSVVLEGAGHAADVIYMAPNVLQSTYPYTL